MQRLDIVSFPQYLEKSKTNSPNPMEEDQKPPWTGLHMSDCVSKRQRKELFWPISLNRVVWAHLSKQEKKALVLQPIRCRVLYILYLTHKVCLFRISADHNTLDLQKKTYFQVEELSIRFFISSSRVDIW